MVAMQPVFDFLHRLEGFEWAAFWIAAFTLVMLAGFFVDYIMQRQGFGPYWNSIYVLGGIWLGLYVRYNYMMPNKVHMNDPFLSFACIMGVTAAMFLVMSFVRNRMS
jgi:hypothetical protein